MSDPINDGFKLYQKGYVTFLGENNGLYEFDVLGSKPKKGGDRPNYYVTIQDGVGFCNNCWSFKKNWNKHTGSFFCKHIAACLFKLAELKGVNQQQDLVDTHSIGGNFFTGYNPGIKVKGPIHEQVKMDPPAPGDLIKNIIDSTSPTAGVGAMKLKKR